MFFWSRKNEGKVILVIEVQSSLVRCSLTWFRESAEPLILSAHESPVPHKTHTDTSYFVKVTMHALTHAVETAHKSFKAMKDDGKIADLPKHISSVHYILSSPWTVSRARTLALSFEHDTKITTGRIRSILEAERAKILPSGPETATEIIEEKIFDVRLNGYKVHDWENMTTRELEVSYVLSVGSTTMSRRFLDAVSFVASKRDVHFHSSLLLQHIGISSLMPDHSSYVLIHVHGDITDIAIVKHHSCVFFGSYPTGSRLIIRKVEKAAKSNEGVADSLLSLYVGGKLDDDHARMLKPIIDEIGASWARGVRDLFEGSEIKGNMPIRALIAATAHEDFFIQSYRRSFPGSQTEALTLKIPLIYASALCDII